MTKTKEQIFVTNKKYIFTSDFIGSIYQQVKSDKVWEVNTIRHLLETNDIFVIRSLIKLYSYQTNEEKLTNSVTVKNRRGFNSYDSLKLSPICKAVIKNNSITKDKVSYVRSKILKYSKQLTAIANGKF